MNSTLTMASWVGTLLLSLIPSLKGCEGEPITFETYEKQGDWFIMKVDVPQGDDQREQNVKKGILMIVSETGVGLQVGKPVNGTLQQVADDYCTRYEKYCEEYMQEEGAPYAPTGYIEITNIHQNELCATFRVSDGVFVNGGPSSHLSIIRFDDGKVMEQEEMINYPAKKLAKLAEKYKTDVSITVPESMADWGYWFIPENTDSCILVWELSRYVFGKAKIPLAEVDQFMTDEGRKLFKAKPYLLPTRPDEATQDEGDEEYDESYDTNIGLNGSIPEGTSTYVGDMSNFPIELTITKDGDGYRADYRNIRFKATMKLNGESLPADGGDVNFYGKDSQGNDWVFHLTGDANTTITGTASGDNKQLNITLRRK